MAEIEESQEPEENFIEEEPPAKRPYYFQLDVLKAIAIAFVVMDHSLTWEIKGSLGSIFWERLSIPFFLLVMGFNMGLSYTLVLATRMSSSSILRYRLDNPTPKALDA